MGWYGNYGLFWLEFGSYRHNFVEENQKHRFESWKRVNTYVLETHECNWQVDRQIEAQNAGVFWSGWRT